MSDSPNVLVAVAVLTVSAASAAAVTALVGRWLFPSLAVGNLVCVASIPPSRFWMRPADCICDPPSWALPFLTRLEECAPLPLDVLAAAAVLMARAQRGDALAVRLAVLACCADAAVCRLLSDADRDCLIDHALRHHRSIGVSGDLLVPLLEDILRRRAELRYLQALLEIHYHRRRFAAIAAAAEAHSRLVDSAWQAVSRPAAPSSSMAADRAARDVIELVGAGAVGSRRFSPGVLESRLIWLLGRSQTKFVPNEPVGHFLCWHLDRCGSREAVARAIEAMPGVSDVDASILHEVFALRTWTLLRPLLRKPSIVTELDRFVTERDRLAFWHSFTREETPHEHRA